MPDNVGKVLEVIVSDPGLDLVLGGPDGALK
jgi:hypothetical protein